MKNYQDLLRQIFHLGTDQFNQRTGKTCRAIMGHQLQYDLRAGFPALTIRKLPFRSIVGELLGFFRGYDNAADFRALGCRFWDANANETKAWLENPARLGSDHLGRIYGKQWTDWRDSRVAMSEEERDALLAQGYGEHLYDPMQGAWLMQRGINQLEAALRMLLTNPSDRRIIVSGWRPDEMDLACLPACHMDYRFATLDGKTLDVVMTLRSWDVPLGGGANIAETALFLSIMARLAGLEPGTVTIQAANAHMYLEDQTDMVEELLRREPYPLPRLVLSERIRKVSLEEIPGVFARIEPEDIALAGYQSHGVLTSAMAA